MCLVERAEGGEGAAAMAERVVVTEKAAVAERAEESREVAERMDSVAVAALTAGREAAGCSLPAEGRAVAGCSRPGWGSAAMAETD